MGSPRSIEAESGGGWAQRHPVAPGSAPTPAQPHPGPPSKAPETDRHANSPRNGNTARRAATTA